jgi:hypothetical protein
MTFSHLTRFVPVVSSGNTISTFWDCASPFLTKTTIFPLSGTHPTPSQKKLKKTTTHFDCLHSKHDRAQNTMHLQTGIFARRGKQKANRSST